MVKIAVNIGTALILQLSQIVFSNVEKVVEKSNDQMDSTEVQESDDEGELFEFDERFLE